MKKYLLIFLGLLFIVISIYYLKSDYKITYKIKSYDIVEKYDNHKYYFEINNKKLYNFDILDKRKISKKQITDIKELKSNNISCIIPVSKKLDTYPLCYKDNKQVSYTIINDKKITNKLKNMGYTKEKENIKTKKDFEFYNNLEKNETIAVWKYNGFYLMNDSSIKTVNLFKKDRYSNDLCYLLDNTLIFPNYDLDHEFNSVYLLNVETGKYKSIKTEYNISYDSYIVGKNKKSLYLFDKKYKIEYEINIKTEEVNEIGNSEKGFFIYKNNKKETTSLSEFNKKITFNLNKNLDYIYDDSNDLTKTYKENKKHRTTIFEGKTKYVDSHNDKVYFVKDDKLYKYIPQTGEKIVIKNYEWKFNLNHTIYIYNK